MKFNMNVFIQLLVAIELVEQLLCVASYTLVLKQVKPLHPSVKVYRYELRHPKILSDATGQYIYHKPVVGQRIYPVVVKPQRDAYRPRGPVKKEKRKFVAKGEKPLLRDPPLYGLSQELVPPVSNQIEEYSEPKEEDTRDQENDIRPLLALPHDEKSFPSFGQEKGRIYKKPGEWATPVPSNHSENTTSSAFTPSQLYLQIRHKNTVIHVPQSEALKDAETLEELINAPRLKELARTTHVQEVYSEEGYEDAGYDHAGHIRHAQHGEVYNAKDEGKFIIKDPPVILDYDSDLEESKKIPLKNVNANEDDTEGEESKEKPEPRITRARTETIKTSVEYKKLPQTYKGEHKYSSRVKNPVKIEEDLQAFNSTENKELPNVETTFPSYFGEIPPVLENIFTNDSAVSSQNPPVKKSSKYRKEDLNSTQIYPVTESAKEFTDFQPYISMIDSQASPSAKSLKYSRIYSKKTKHLSLQPYKTGSIYQPPPLPYDKPPLPPPTDKTPEEEPLNQRIVLPTIGYINSLTTAHFGKASQAPPQEESKTQLTSALNLTEALNYLRSNKSQKNLETPKLASETDIRTFEPMRLRKSRPSSRNFSPKSKRDIYLIKERRKRDEEEYEGNDESDAPHNEKNEEIAEDERKRIEDENREKERYEAELRAEISQQEKEIIKETLKNIGVEEDISEVFPELPPPEASRDSDTSPSETTPTPVDLNKYPFYFSQKLPENSPLRYATDPKQFPRKSGYKMEFYDSRDRYIQCPDFHPDLDDLPNSNSTEYSDTQPGDNQRLAGVGDKIACLRMKYFDKEPFDNPIFKEREIDYVGKPKKGRKFQKKVPSSQTPKRLIPGIKSRSAIKPPKYVSDFNRVVRIPQGTKPQNVFVLPQPVTLTTKAAGSVAESTTPSNYFMKVTYNISNSHQSSAHSSNTQNLPRIVFSHKCLPMLSKLSVLDGTKNLIVDCHDAIIIQEITQTIPHLRIIPKESRPQPKSSDQTDWVPIVGYILPKPANKSVPLSRKTDEVTVTKNETNQNASSDHYVIDELKEEENVRKGEVIEDMEHYLKLMETPTTETPEEVTKTENATRRRREAESLAEEINSTRTPSINNENPPLEENSWRRGTEKSETSKDAVNGTVISRPFASKRTLTRLSGRDFLVRYHKNKAKPIGFEKTSDFWKIPTLSTSSKPELSKLTAKIPEAVPTQKYKANESRKISPLNLIPEKITKKPVTDKPSSQNRTKIITKVSRETSESSEKPRIVFRKVETTTEYPTTTTYKSENPPYQIIDRSHQTIPPNIDNPEETTQHSVEATEGPILYYVVDLKTGRGRWITDYEELLRGKLRKKQKLTSSTNRGKRRKKPRF